MDLWLDTVNGASTINDMATLGYMKSTFTVHYTGNRQPIGLCTHPIYLSTTYRCQSLELDHQHDQLGAGAAGCLDGLERAAARVQNPCPSHSSTRSRCSSAKSAMASRRTRTASSRAATLQTSLSLPVCSEIELTVDNSNPVEQVPNGQQARFQLPTAAPALLRPDCRKMYLHINAETY
ncbi:hypothetical protein B0H10DRAFT_2069033, partial [Mycena sp. CBHHK59/15]